MRQSPPHAALNVRNNGFCTFSKQKGRIDKLVMAFVAAGPLLVRGVVRYTSAFTRKVCLAPSVLTVRATHMRPAMASTTSAADAAERVSELRGPEVCIVVVV